MRNNIGINRNLTMERSTLMDSLILSPIAGQNFTSAKTITKSIPIEFKFDLISFLSNLYKIIFSTSIFMISFSIILLFFTLPLQNLNSLLLSQTKDLTTTNSGLLIKMQETTSYRKLFQAIEGFSLVEPKNVVYVNQSPSTNSIIENSFKFTNYKNYPSFNFAGF